MSAQEILEAINCLLEELSTFLSSKDLKKSLSKHHQLQNEADRLLKEAKLKCDLIKILAEQLGDNKIVNYVAMDLKTETQTEEPLSDYIEGDHLGQVPSIQEPEEETYDVPNVDTTDTVSADVTVLTSTTKSTESLECPYNSTAYNQLVEVAKKTGPLYRKERRFILDQKKHFTACLIDNWLLLYTNKKDKPIQYIDLTDHEARKKKEPMFELVCEGKKSLEFYAKTTKEMESWITTINYLTNSNTITPEQDLNPRRSQEEQEINVMITGDDESGEIYATIEDIKQKLDPPEAPIKKVKRKLPEVPPALPERSKDTRITTTKEQQKNNKNEPKLIEYANWDEANGRSEIIEDEYDELLVTTQAEINDKLNGNILVINNHTGSSLNNSNRPSVYEDAQEDNDYDELMNYQPRPVNPNQTTLPVPNIIIRQASPLEEEEVDYDEIPNFRPISQHSADSKKSVNNPNERNTTVQEKEDDIYDELAAVVSNVLNQKRSIQQLNNIPVAKAPINEEVYDGYLVPKKSPVPPSTPEEDDIYDDLANVTSQQPVKQPEPDPEPPANSKINFLKRELFRGKSPVKETPKLLVRKQSIEKKEEVFVKNEIKKPQESPRKLQSLIQQMELNLSFNKRKEI